MTLKSIFEVELNITEFDRFYATYQKYQEGLAKMPKDWEAAAAAQRKLAEQMNKINQMVQKQNQLQDEGDGKERERYAQLHKNVGLWEKMAQHSQSMSKHVLDIGAVMLKWGSLLGGGALFGSILGIDRLARSIGDTRSTSMGFGVSPATLQAFNVNFSKVMDTQGFLSSMTTMETDVSKRSPWYALMRGKPMSGDTTQDSLAMIQSLREFAQRTPKELLGTMGRAFQLPADEQTLLRFKNTPDKEWAATMASMQRDQKSFGLNDAGAAAWQRLSIQFDRVSMLLKDKFAVALEPLAPKLDKLSGAFGDTVAAFLQAPAVKQATMDLTGELNDLTKSMQADNLKGNASEMSAAVASITQSLKLLAATFGWLTKMIRPFPDAKTPVGFWEHVAKAGTLARTWEVNAAADVYNKFTLGRPAQVTDSVARDFPWAQQLAKYGDLSTALAASAVGDPMMKSALDAQPNYWKQFVSPDLQQLLGLVGDQSGAQISFPRGTASPASGESFFAWQKSLSPELQDYLSRYAQSQNDPSKLAGLESSNKLASGSISNVLARLSGHAASPDDIVKELKHYGGDETKAASALLLSGGEKQLDSIIRGHKADWQDEVRKIISAQGAAKVSQAQVPGTSVIISIINATGADVHTSINALAAG